MHRRLLTEVEEGIIVEERDVIEGIPCNEENRGFHLNAVTLCNYWEHGGCYSHQVIVEDSFDNT